MSAGLSFNPTTGLIFGTATAAGNFPVVLSATNAAGLTGIGALSLTVPAAPGTVTLGQLNFEYDGAPKPVTVTTTPAGLSVSVRYDGSAVVPANAGSYAVTAMISDPNYNGSANGTLVITPAPATVSLENLAQTYDGSPRAATAATSPAGLAVALAYEGAANAPVDAGSYGVTAVVTDPNHTGSGSGTLVVAKGTGTITFNHLVQTYEGAPKPGEVAALLRQYRFKETERCRVDGWEFDDVLYSR